MIWQVPPKVTPEREKKHRPRSAHRENKTGVHITVNGLGRVSGLFRHYQRRRGCGR